MKQRGDTIVEVLFAMIIIGAVLGAAFGIANRSLAIGRSAQERTEALKIAESQIELIKVAYDNDFSNIRTRNGVGYCLFLKPDGSLDWANDDQSACKDKDVNRNPGLFSASIIPTKAGPLVYQFDIIITWDRIGTNSTDKGKLALYYRVKSP